MENKRGLFIVFEGIDGSGEDTQLDILYKRIKKEDKYQDIIATHEPWKNEEIKRRLREDKEAYSDPRGMSLLYIFDRTKHSYLLAEPNIKAGGFVLCSRYKMSTCAFQQAQGMSLDELLEMHEHRGILVPDLTIFLDVSREVAEERRKKRGGPPEKFERDREFIDKVVKNYRDLVELSKHNPDLFGRVVRIDGERSIEEVAEEVYRSFNSVYRKWKGEFDYSDVLKVYRKDKEPVKS